MSVEVSDGTDQISAMSVELVSRIRKLSEKPAGMS